MSTTDSQPSVKKEIANISSDGSPKKKFIKKLGKKKFGNNKKFGDKRGPKQFGNKKFDNKLKNKDRKFNKDNTNKKKPFIKNQNIKKKNITNGTTPENKVSTDGIDPSLSEEQKEKKKMERMKRPKLSQAYYDAAYILRMMSLKKGSINMLISTLHDQKKIKQVYALAIKVIKNEVLIKKIVAQFALPEKVNMQLVEVLIADLVFGQKLFQKYRRTGEVLFVIENQQKILDFFKTLKGEFSKPDEGRPQIRYFRVNLLKTNSDDLISKLKATGKLNLKTYSKDNLSFDDFKKIALELKPMQFMHDYHFDDVFLYHDSATKVITSLEEYENKLLAIQDKSSMLAIESMGLKPGMKVLDACAAPGMKTIAIASRLNNDCILYANDMNQQRYKVMRTFLHKFGAKTDKLLNVDFSQLNPFEYQDLDVILLDPSCSGSGMARRFDYGQRTSNEEYDLKAETRCRKLAKFQLCLLDSALKFFPKKIIYCTCSNLQMENEDVINQLLANNPDIQYEVIDPLPEWPARGTGDYEFSARCLRADADSTLTSGFFCCVLQRKEGAVKPDLSTLVPTNEENCVKSEEDEKADVTEKPAKQSQRNKVAAATPQTVRQSARIKRRAESSQDEAGTDSTVEETASQTARKSKRLRK